jgi:hypothetical protein
MLRRTALSLAAMALTLVATSGTALAQGGGTCAAGSCLNTQGGDLMIGTPDSNGLQGLGGNDLIGGLGGNDFLTGDNGNDAVHGSWGDDLVTGGWGDDQVVGGSGGDVLQGGSGADRIEAQDGFADVISCGAGSGDLVVFDADLDSVAADCEAPRARCTSKVSIQQVRNPCGGICKCKTCKNLSSLRRNGSCENKYRRQCVQQYPLPEPL